MSEVGSVHNPGVASPPQARLAPLEQEQRSAARELTAVRDDHVELSEAALRFDEELDAAQAVQRRIAEIRAGIADGTYLTPDKLDAAIEGLCRDVARNL